MQTASDDQAIRSLIDQFIEGWNAADGSLCARPFTSNSDFTAINGIRARGRDLIARGHSEILSTIYRGTQLNGVVNSIDYLRPDVASVDATFHLTPAQTWFPKYTSCGIIATKDAGVWSIAVFRNMVPFGRPTGGPLDRQLVEESAPKAN